MNKMNKFSTSASGKHLRMAFAGTEHPSQPDGEAADTPSASTTINGANDAARSSTTRTGQLNQNKHSCESSREATPPQCILQQHQRHCRKDHQQSHYQSKNSTSSKAQQQRSSLMTKPTRNQVSSGQQAHGQKTQSGISAAKFLSPTRLHVSQHIKPLFANRSDRISRQGSCSSKHALNLNVKPMTTTGSSISSAKNGGQSSTSYYESGESCSQPWYQKDLTPLVDTGRNEAAAGPFKRFTIDGTRAAANSKGVFEMEFRELAGAGDEQGTFTTTARCLVQADQQLDQDTTRQRGSTQRNSSPVIDIITCSKEAGQAQIQPSYIEQDSAEVPQLYNSEPVAQELPLDNKKFKSSGGAGSRISGVGGCFFPNKKERVSRKSRPAKPLQSQPQRDELKFDPPTSISDKAAVTKSKVRSPSGVLFNAMSMQQALTFHHKNGLSVSSQSSGICDYPQNAPGSSYGSGSGSDAQSSNFCVNLLVYKSSQIRNSSTASTRQSFERQHNYTNTICTTATQQTLTSHQQKVPKSRKSRLSGGAKGTSRDFKHEPPTSRMSQSGAQATQIKDNLAPQSEKGAKNNTNNTASLRSAKSRTCVKDHQSVNQPHIKAGKVQKQQQHVIGLSNSRLTRNSMLMSPSRSQTYQPGVLHQKRKGSTKNQAVQKTHTSLGTNSTKIQHQGTNGSKSGAAHFSNNMTAQQSKLRQITSIQSLSLKNFVEAQSTSNTLLQQQVITSKASQRSSQHKTSTAQPSQVIFDPSASTKKSSARASKPMLAPYDANNPSSLNISQKHGTLLNKTRASLKKRRSREDASLSSTHRLLRSGLISPTGEKQHYQRSSRINQTAMTVLQQKNDKILAKGQQQVAQAAGAKSFRSLLKKSKSQSRVSSKRQPLDEVNANLAPAEANVVEPAKLEDVEVARINIRTAAQNYTEESQPRLGQQKTLFKAPRGDNTPIDETASGIYQSQPSQSAMLPTKGENYQSGFCQQQQRGGEVKTPGLNLSSQDLLTKQQHSESTVVFQAYLGNLSRATANSQIQQQIVQSSVCSPSAYMTVTVAPTPMINIDAGSCEDSSMAPTELFKQSLRRTRVYSEISTSGQHNEYSQNNAQFSTSKVKIDIPSNSSSSLAQHVQVAKKSGQQQQQSKTAERLYEGESGKFEPVRLASVPNHRRRRSHRLRQTQKSKAAPCQKPQAQKQQQTNNLLQQMGTAQAPLVIKLDLNSSESLQKDRHLHEQANCEIAGASSLVEGAENCQGGMTQNHMMDHQAQEVVDMPQAAGAEAFDQHEENADYQLLAEYCHEGDNHFDLADVAQEAPIFDSVEKVTIHETADQQSYSTVFFKGGSQLIGTGFDDILERRDLEKSPRGASSLSQFFAETESLRLLEGQNNQIQVFVDEASPMELDQQLTDTNRHSDRLALLSDGAESRHAKRDPPYQAVKKFERQEPETSKHKRRKSLSKSGSQCRVEKTMAPAGARQLTFSSHKMSRNSTCMSPTGFVTGRVMSGVIDCTTNMQRYTPGGQLQPTGRKNKHALNKSGDRKDIVSGSRQDERCMDSDIRMRTLDEHSTKAMVKSHSQINTAANATKSKNQTNSHQKFFNVGLPLTPRKPSGIDDTSRNKRLHNQKSVDLQSNCDNVSQSRMHKSPGARSGRSGGTNGTGMYVLKSTKKLTTFKEFAITPSAKDGSGKISRCSAFISPLKLKKLEKRHGVSLMRRECQDSKNTVEEETDEEPNQIDPNIHEKNRALLKDNAAMDAYMRDLCNKYF